MSNGKITKLMLRYYPPGIVLETISAAGELETKSIDLLDLKDS